MPSSIAEKSFSHFLLSILITPFEVKSMAFRPLRVGITQSNISTPRAMHSRIFQGVPTPMRYLGLSTGRSVQQASQMSYSCASGSPTLSPPMALPTAPFEDTYSQEALRRSPKTLPWTIGKRFWVYPYLSGVLPNRAIQRSSHRWVRCMDFSAYAYSLGKGGHSSKAMIISP